MDAIPSADLRLGLKALTRMDGVEMLGTTYNAENATWVLHLRLTIIESSIHVPAVTEWYVLISEAYPLGRVDFRPAKAGGLRTTFRHMKRNDFDSKLWGTGAPCLDRPGRWLGNRALVGQPNTAAGKLRFYTDSALRWLECAAKDQLTAKDEPFELPEFASSGAVIGFDESADQFVRWKSLMGRVGSCNTHEIRKDVTVIDGFFVGDATVFPRRWGRHIANIEKTGFAFWCTLPKMPIIAPWKAPMTWGELRKCAGDARTNLDELLRQVYRRIRACDVDEPQTLLVGFPIPDFYDGEDVQMHWQPLTLPAQINRSIGKTKNAREKVIWNLQLTRTLSDATPLAWRHSENWSEATLRVRGALDDNLRKAKVALIGTGSLGSALAEMLVREGVNDLGLFDDDDLAVGNLRRHVLTMENVGMDKALALARRLNAASPFAKVYAGPRISTREHQSKADLTAFDIIIDCTANEDVIGSISRRLKDDKSRWYFCGSTGIDARRLFLYSEFGRGVDADAYEAAMRKPLAEEQAIIEERGLNLMHGSGCWNPVFPARWSSVQTRAAEMLECIERLVKSGKAPTNQLEIVPADAA